MGLFREKEFIPDLIEPGSGFRFLRPEIQKKIGQRAVGEIDALVKEAENDPTFNGEIKSLPTGVGEVHPEDMTIAPFYKKAVNLLLGRLTS